MVSKEWIKSHDAEIVGWSLYFLLKGAAFFVTSDDEYLYATFHGHADDVLGVMLTITFIKYFWERTQEEK